MGQPADASLTQQPRWRVRSVAFGLLIAGALMIGLLTESRYLLGGTLLIVGLSCLGITLTKNNEQLRRYWGNTAGPGWWLGWLISKAPGPSARILAVFLSLGVTAFGGAILLGF
jgi:hypothetical protein